MIIGAPHGHIVLWLVNEEEKISRTVFINGEEKTFMESTPAPNFKNCVEGKKGQERAEGIRKIEEFADLLISVAIDDSLEKCDATKYQTHR